MHRSSRRLALAVLGCAFVLALPAAGAQAKLATPAKKFLAEQQTLQRQFGASQEKQMLAVIAAKRRYFGTCSVFRRLPRDTYEKQISLLYVLLDMIQEMTAPYAPQLASAAGVYRTGSYGDPVLNRAARTRYAHLRALSQLKPFDSCSVLNGWAEAGWPTEWKPSGETGIAAAAIYDQDVQIPDKTSLLRRLRKLGATPFQRSRTKQFAISERILDELDSVVRKLFPRVDIDWR